ncbi:serine/threonine-protein kinase pakD-like [Teleopsis dalmanni]|uniref:serine/threonine-protein kinase pakD-like n=1 Tax=Teleopsis dalmanni TaxID=139649 RepID=UPI0018CCC159|nr:serine/threonine-protein kinase pakD-like [Teleopsis dalmanni]
MFTDNIEDAADVSPCVRCTKFASYVCQMCGDYYCSAVCQKLDWPSHRYICWNMPKLILKKAFDKEIMPVEHPWQKLRSCVENKCAEDKRSANNSYKFKQRNIKKSRRARRGTKQSSDVDRISLQREQANPQLHKTKGQYGKIEKQQFNHDGQQDNDAKKRSSHGNQHQFKRDDDQQHGEQFDNNEPYRQANDVLKGVNQQNSDSALKENQQHGNSGNKSSQNYDAYDLQYTDRSGKSLKDLKVNQQQEKKQRGPQQCNDDVSRGSDKYQQRNLGGQQQRKYLGQQQQNNDGQRQRNNGQQRVEDGQEPHINNIQQQRNNDDQQQQQQRNNNGQQLRNNDGQQQQQRNYNGQQDQNKIVTDQILNSVSQDNTNDRRSGNESRQSHNRKSQHDMPQQQRPDSRNISNSKIPQQSNENQKQNPQNYSESTQRNYPSYQTNRGHNDASQQERQFNNTNSTNAPVLKPPFEIKKLDENCTNFLACVIDTSCIREGLFACIPAKDYVSFINMQMFLTKMDKGGQPYKPVLNEYCLALFQEEWYRAKVIGAYGNEFKVEYIDFINQGFVKIGDIRRYPLGLTGVNSTSLCKLAGLPDQLSSNLVDKLEDMVVDCQKLYVQTVKKCDKFYEVECPVLLKQLSELGFI